MKKAVLSLALALLTGASLLAGCAPQATEPDSGTKQDEVVISISSEPDSLDPCQGWGWLLHPASGLSHALHLCQLQRHFPRCEGDYP